MSIVNGYLICKNEGGQTVVKNTTGIKLVCDSGPGCKLRAIDWARSKPKGEVKSEAQLLTIEQEREAAFAEYCEEEAEALLASDLASEQPELADLVRAAEELSIDLSGVKGSA